MARSWHQFLLVERARKAAFVARLAELAAQAPASERRLLHQLIGEHEQWIAEIDEILSA